MLVDLRFRNRAIILFALFVVFFSALTGCNKKTPTGPDNPTSDVPILVDVDGKTVKIYAEINAVYFDSSSWHCIVFKDMTNGDKALFRSHAEPLDLYDGLIDIGAQPGNNMNPTLPDSVKDTLHVQGDIIEIFVEWDGAPKTYSLTEVANDSIGNGIEIRFGGNKETQEAWETGCLTCWVSCPAGITSNAKYCSKDFSEGKVNITGLSNMLPSDGTGVIVTYKPKQ